jgi:thiol-disulfide isomerase/thioredoxin
MRKISRVGKPLDIKFSALDGSNVDLQSMRGKVVLVDFWATWCETCIDELPKMKQVYQRLHPKGFEIIGISLDMNKQALLEMIAKEEISWAQFFDESGEGNRIADEFEIVQLPVLWLVDKKGNLRHLGARDDLAAKVEKLLAE